MTISGVWRELFRYPSLEEAVTAVAPLLVSELGLLAVVVRRVELDRGVITTTAWGPADSALSLPPMRRECSGEELAALMSWFRAGEVRVGPCGEDPVLRVLAGPGRSVVLAGPLADADHGALGALVVWAAPGRHLPRLKLETARLLEPFRTALANSRRFQELARLREVVEADNRALLSKLDRQEIMGTLVGAETGFRSVMDRIEQVAPTDAPVLLMGETGTGKEVVARAIHGRSRRANGPMLRVNCGAIPPGLIDSELFGHERGSFTGAVAARSGWFERADGGTLFLDEIGELPLAAQVRLLRVLQEGAMERVGGQRSVSVDVRIVAATHRDLESMVSTGTFREDLWYRISVFPIPIPPLRERRQDIPALSAHFAWHAGKRIGGGPLAPAPADVELLLAYDWPGNVRELASVIERAAILGDGKRLDIGGALGARRFRAESAPSERMAPAELPGRGIPSGPGIAPERGAVVNSLERPLPPKGTPFEPLDDAIRHHIEAALTRSRGKIEGRGGAAELLKINPYTLRSKMRKLGIAWQGFREYTE